MTCGHDIMIREFSKKNNRRLYSMGVSLLPNSLFIATKSRLIYHLQAGVPKKKQTRCSETFLCVKYKFKRNARCSNSREDHQKTANRDNQQEGLRLTLLHSEWPKPQSDLTLLSAKGLTYVNPLPPPPSPMTGLPRWRRLL